MTQLLAAAASAGGGKSGASLGLASVDEFGLHYAETLRRWRANFNAALDEVRGGSGSTAERLGGHVLVLPSLLNLLPHLPSACLPPHLPPTCLPAPPPAGRPAPRL